MVNIYRDAKRRGIYLPLFTNLRGIVVLVFTVPNQMDKKTLLQFLLLKLSQITIIIDNCNTLFTVQYFILK